MRIEDFFGPRLADLPEVMRERIGAILSPEMPDSLESVIQSLPPRPRYIGPEAWLAALSNASESADPAKAGAEMDHPRKRR